MFVSARSSNMGSFSMVFAIVIFLSVNASGGTKKLHELLGKEFLFDSQEIQSLHQMAEGYFHQGDYIAAQKRLGDALVIARGADQSDRRAIPNLLTSIVRWTPSLIPRGAIFKLVFAEVCSGFFLRCFSRASNHLERESDWVNALAAPSSRL